MKKYGYIRVSTKEQNLERQRKAMYEYGIKPNDVLQDMISGKDFNRPEYKKLVRKLKQGDLVVIKSIDRLGRDYQEIIEEWRKITLQIGANIHVIDMPLLNTDSAHGDLTGRLIADMVLQIMAYVAETERAFIRQRQAEGIAIAQMKGVKFGAKRVKIPDAFDEYYEKWKNKEISVRKAAKQIGVSCTTFYRRCKEKDSSFVS